MTKLLLAPPPLAYDRTFELRRNQEIERFARAAVTRGDIPTQTTRTFRTITASGSVGLGDDVVLVDATAGPVTITLPPASDLTKEFSIKKTDGSGNAVTLDPDSAETIDGSATLILSTNDAVRIASDGSAWWIL